MTKYRATVEVDGEPGLWHGNALTFDTPEAALAYGADLYSRWMLAQRYRIEVSHKAQLKEGTEDYPIYVADDWVFVEGTVRP